LWAIAVSQLGDPFRWPEIAAASAGITQSGGNRLADPDLVRTGWILHLPTTPPAERSPEPSDQSETQGVVGPPSVAADGYTFTSVSSGTSHSCALDEAGHAWCWGWEEEGALGDGPPDEETETSPVAVAGDRRFTSIRAGHSSTCALEDPGKVWCWGTDLGLVPVEPPAVRPPTLDDVEDIFP